MQRYPDLDSGKALAPDRRFSSTLTRRLRVFANGLPPTQAAHRDRRRSRSPAARLGEPLTVAPAWKTVPSVVRRRDAGSRINPELERFMASGMNAHVTN